MKSSIGELANEWSIEDVYSEFSGELARTIVAKSKEILDLHAIKEKAKRRDSIFSAIPSSNF